MTLNAAEIGSWSLDAVTGMVIADSSLARAFSISPEIAAVGAPLKVFTDAIHPADRAQTIATINQALANGDAFEAEYRLIQPNGLIRWVIGRGRVTRDQGGKAVNMSGVLIDITERKHSEQLVLTQNDVLRLAASETSLSTILEKLVRQVEAPGNGNTIASILLIDEEGRLRHGAAPGLPDDYNQAMDGIPIGENVGTCGRAAFLREAVVSLDLAADPNWALLKDQVAALGLLAAWSAPIISTNGKVLGTFGTYFREKRGPTTAEKGAIDFLAKTAALVIERAQAQEMLRQTLVREKAAHEEAESAKNHFRSLFESAPGYYLVLTADDNYEVVAVSNAYLRATMTERKAIMHRKIFEVFPDDPNDPNADGVKNLRASFERLRKSNRPDVMAVQSYAIRRSDGTFEERYWSPINSAALDTNGKLTFIIHRVEDVTEYVQMQRQLANQIAGKPMESRTGQMEAEIVQRGHELRQALEKLQQANRAKDDFLAALSHELRTPLNVVLLLATDAVSRTDLSEEIQSSFEMIRKNAEFEARLIDDLLDVTSIARGKLALDKQSVDIHVVLQDAIAGVQSDINQKRISLILRLDTVQPMVNGDSVRLQQVFWNLLKNAAKFTPQNGRIVIKTSSPPGESRIVITFSDSGIGMTPEELARIFGAFSQGDHAGESGSHRFGGLGLGLAISKSLVESHAGSLQATSEGQGQGSTFTVELPLGINTFGPLEKAISSDLSPTISSQPNRRVLLVEDHEASRIALAHLLTRRNYVVTAASSMAEALKLAKAGKFDLVISDIGLPDGNGKDLMIELKALYSLNGIALTGYGMEQDIAECLQAGFLTHLTKPVRVQSLENALALVARALS